MILTVNIGNTHIHLGLFIRGALRQTWRLSSRPLRTSDEYALLLRGLLGEGVPLVGAVVSSVVSQIEWPMASAIEAEFKIAPLILDETTQIGLVNGYAHPSEVGMDRLANAVGACRLFDAPIMALDFGTAVTLDYVAAPGDGADAPVYVGGAILPGIEMSADALFQGTSKLPRVSRVEPVPRVLGRTTVESIRAGLIHGFVGAITMLVERAREEIGMACRVVATGGNALDFQPHLPFLHAVEPHLTLYGLHHIHGLNRNDPSPTTERKP